MGHNVFSTLAAVGMALLSAPAIPSAANQPQATAGPADVIALCKAESTAARHVMQLRQRGATMAAVMETTRSDESSVFSELQRRIVMRAYDRPRFSTKEAIEAAVRDFENEQYLECARRNSLADS